MRDFLPMTLQQGDVAVDWPSPAAGAMRLTSDACGVARLHSIEPARRGCGCGLAITRGWRHAAHGQGDFCLPCNNVRAILLPQRSISFPSFFDTG